MIINGKGLGWICHRLVFSVTGGKMVNDAQRILVQGQSDEDAGYKERHYGEAYHQGLAQAEGMIFPASPGR